MDIVFMYDFNNNEYEALINKIENTIKTKVKIKSFKKNKLTSKTKHDVYVLVSDDINEIEMYSKGIKYKNNIIIITENISSSYIINLVKITKNICYLKNELDVIAKKIYSIYLESCELNG